MNLVKRNTTIYYATQLFHSLIFTIPIWIVFYQARITLAQISILVTFQYFIQLVLELPSGALADLIGRKNTNLIGFFAGAISSLAFPLAGNIYHFTMLAFLIGLSDSFRSGSEEALVYDTFKQVGQEEKFDKVYTNGNLVYQAGLIIATALGGLIFSLNQYLPYILHGLSMFIGAILVAFYVEPKIDSMKFTLSNYYRQIITGCKEAFKTHYSTYLSLFYITVGGITWSATLYFNSYMLVELIPEDSLRGLINAAMRFINVVIIATVLKNDKLFNWKRRIIFFPLIMLIGFIPGNWLHGFIGVPFVQAAMIATTARWILLTPLTNQTFSSQYRATAISLLSLLIGFIYIFLTSVSAYIIPHFGIKTMYTFMGITTLVTVVPITFKLIHIKSAQSSTT